MQLPLAWFGFDTAGPRTDGSTARTASDGPGVYHASTRNLYYDGARSHYHGYARNRHRDAGAHRPDAHHPDARTDDCTRQDHHSGVRERGEERRNVADRRRNERSRLYRLSDR